MRKINTQYIRTTGNAIDGIDAPCIVQSFGMRLVASIRTFLPTLAGEESRLKFLDHNDPYYYAKATGYRVYAKLEGSFHRISPEDMEANKEEIHDILREMAEMYADSISDGMRRQYRDCEKSQLREGMRPISDPRHPQHAQWLAAQASKDEE